MTKYDFAVIRTNGKDPDALTWELDEMGSIGFAVVGVTSPDGHLIMQREQT